MRPVPTALKPETAQPICWMASTARLLARSLVAAGNITGACGPRRQKSSPFVSVLSKQLKAHLAAIGNIPHNKATPVYFIALMLLATPCLALGERVYMLGKIKLRNTTDIKTVLFYDRGITSISDCRREVQRGTRGQWRYYHHKFTTPKGFAQRVDYYCVKSSLTAGPWLANARYDKIYTVDIRQQQMKIKLEHSYASCLKNLRTQVRNETSTFFCAKLSQSLSH